MEYFSPHTTDEAVSLLKEYGDKVIIIAGGTFFMSHRIDLFTDVEILVDIKKLGLSYIKEDNEGLRIGATTSLASILECDIVGKTVLTVIHETIREIKISEIRNMATLGGDVSISAEVDMPITLLALDAKLLIAGPDGKRTLPLDEFYLGYLNTALNRCEIIAEIQIPYLRPKTGAAFHKLTRTAVDVPIVNAATRITLTDDDKCSAIKIVLGGLANTPVRAGKAETLLMGKNLNLDSITKAAETAAEIECMTDIRASSEVRRRWAKVAIERVLTKAYVRAKGGIEK